MRERAPTLGRPGDGRRPGDRRRGEGIWLVTYDGDWRETFRPDIPSVARIYDYLLASSAT
jgi:hypothetical protein